MSVLAPLQRKPQPGAAPRVSALGAAVRVQREPSLQKAPAEAAEPIAAHASPRGGAGSPACECMSCAASGASGGGAGPGASLPDGARRFFESRFGHDFSKVRVFDDASAHARARGLGAAAFTRANEIHFAAGRYNPSTPSGQWVLAHELAHVAQQGAAGARPRPSTAALSAECATAARAEQGAETEHAAEHQAHEAAASILSSRRTPAITADGRGVRTHLLTEAQFRSALGTTSEQVAAIDTLFSNAEFLALWNYLKMCGATPVQDVGPLALRVTPGLVIRGVVRFGGYDPATRTLEINPTKPEHVTNPGELVDTITHELIHAVDDLQTACVAAGSSPSPLAAAGARTVSPVAAADPGFIAALRSTGPSASDPCGETIDENAAALDIIGRVLQSNVSIAGVGHPTLTFVNLIIRGDPAAFTFYNSCRTAACAVPAPAARATAITNCSQQTIARFLPPAMTSALLPAQVFFDFDRSDLHADARETLHLVALFLTSHPATTVTLIGHADITGPAAYNVGLGQRRADVVRAFLLGAGVPALQIASTTSTGAAGASATPSRMPLDRRVEIRP
jgi:outer membrane protein OmpA-like peptidoglycan-associated protein